MQEDNTEQQPILTIPEPPTEEQLAQFKQTMAQRQQEADQWLEKIAKLRQPSQENVTASLKEDTADLPQTTGVPVPPFIISDEDYEKLGKELVEIYSSDRAPRQRIYPAEALRPAVFVVTDEESASSRRHNDLNGGPSNETHPSGKDSLNH